MDITKLAPNRWIAHLNQWRAGELLDRAAIIATLENGETIPAEAGPMLAALITGEACGRRGRPGGLTASVMMARTIEYDVHQIEIMLAPGADLSDLDKPAQDFVRALRNQPGTPNAKARKWVAGVYDVSVATVSACITRARKSRNF
ncbi:MAG: hypothetical protein J0H15_11530 [Xanthomonadales bacterium]|nr:hypothetical protein [Xanthomonadales bacterium]